MSALIFKRIKLTLLLCLITTIPVFAQSDAWVRYKAEDFSVLLPEHPNTIEIVRPSKAFEKSRTGRLFSAYEDRVVYVILTFDNPKHRDPLSRFIDEIEKFNTSGKAERFQQDLSAAGLTGKEYGFSNGPTTNGVVRFYLAADRVYILEAIGDDVTKPSVQRFLDSFLVGNADGAKDISYANPLPAQRLRNSTDEPDAGKQSIFPGRDVTTKARVLVKPEPMYTEAAREALTTGTVVLRGVFTSTGQVTNLSVRSGLPNGLTERAIIAARNIRFIPAMKDGRHVSMYIQLEYNFNLY